jgi:hypothetical protein
MRRPFDMVCSLLRTFRDSLIVVTRSEAFLEAIIQ